MAPASPSCPIPLDEPRRLAAVRSYEVLDTGPELEFDALTRVAAHAFNVPIAVVALMDSNRLWFKSRLGLDLPQLDRQIAFCAHAIMQPDQPMIVEDLAADLRFADNPLVTNPPHVRFYAGAPLVDPESNALGTIAVIDSSPRSFSPEQRAALVDLASLVVAALQGRRRALQLARLAMTDHLTGIANRARFEQVLKVEFNQAERSGNTFSVLLVDLDGFKSVNDTYGHSAGDEVLCAIAKRLEQLVRQGDTCTRVGGDEFGLVIRSGDARATAALSARIQQCVAQPITLSDNTVVTVGASVGAATYHRDMRSVDMLLAHADAALYEAKEHASGSPELILRTLRS
jgi:diguanylate cyclase (GGDEF)-like protein